MSSHMPYTSKFAGKRILIVEDEFLLADEARQTLSKFGAVVVGPTPYVERALDLIDDEPVDAAILDVLLNDELVFPVADRLEERSLPFVFATGCDAFQIPPRFSGYVLCEKPLELEKIARGLFGPDWADA